MKKPTRPPLRYHGGKWRMAQHIIPHFPVHKTYCELYGGGASILLRKPRAKNEIYNDLDGDIVNVFKVLRNKEQSKKLLKLLELTPFARDEMKLAWEETDDIIEQARRTIVRSQMGFGSAGATKGRTGFRGLDCYEGSYSSPAKQWMELPKALYAIIDRLQGVILENKPALCLIDAADQKDTLFYLDPPYMHETRSSVTNSQKYYRHEMTDEDHIKLLEKVLQIQGMCIISGYRTDLYMDALKDWKLLTFSARASSKAGTVIREECIWISPNCKQQDNLFCI
ncbi:MAG: DNA adenine methylase [Sulfurovaceae bacterium]|nr:DNA adenine methylase [Sulfurovaceae bacterium]MDD5549090.1 DNA adenine methylase [Sulfurovaceae bacterium]